MRPAILTVVGWALGFCTCLGGDPRTSEQAFYDDWIAAASDTIKSDPTFVPAYLDRAWAWELLGETERAAADYDTALMLMNVALFTGEYDAPLLFQHGQICLARGHVQSAVHDFEVALLMDPTNVRIRKAHLEARKALPVRAIYAETEFEETRATYRYPVVETEPMPEDAEGYVFRAMLKFDDKDLHGTIADLDKALQLDPNFEDIVEFRNLLLLFVGNYDRAAVEFEDALRKNPEDEDTAGYLYATLILGGDFDRVIAECTDAIRADPSDVGAYAARSELWMLKGDYQRALADARETTELEPKSAKNWSSLAWILATSPQERIRNGRQAVEYATKACELDDWKNAASLDTLAAAYAECGNMEKAIEWQTKAVELTEDEQDKLRAAKRLALYRSGRPFRDDPQAEYREAKDELLKEFRDL